MRKLRKIRIALAALSFLALTAAFVDFTGTCAGCFGALAKIQLVPAALALAFATVTTIVALTLVCGRVYCSVVCPLGILQDVVVFFRRLFGLKFKAPVSDKTRMIRDCFRGSFLAFFVGGGFLGLHFTCLEPYAIYGRAASTLFAPLYRLGNNALAAWAEAHASYAFHAVEVVAPAAGVMVTAAGFFALIVALAAWRGRFWCNTICPVGTVLGCVAKAAYLKPRIDTAKCVKCGRCVQVCKTQSIDIAKGKIDYSTCVACCDCGAVCAKGALTWSK